MDLPELADLLLSDGLASTYATSDAGGRVEVSVDLDALDHPLVIVVTAVDADVDPGVELFQVFAGLPFDLTDEQLDTVVRHLPALNVLAPVGALSVSPDDRVAFYRHVAVIERDRLEPVKETVWLAHFALNLLVPPLMGIAELVEV